MANIGQNYQISDAENELTGMLHGTSLNQIFDLNGVFNRAARRVMQDIDPPETKVFTQFGQVWQGVYEYDCPVDLKGDKVIYLLPQANVQLNDYIGQSYSQPFEIQRNFTLAPQFNVNYSNGTRILKVNVPQLPQGAQLNAADAVSDNGTWTAGTNVSNVQSDSQYFTSGASGSVSFTIAAGVNPSTANIYNGTMGSLDLTNQFNNAYFFFQVYLPNASGFTNVKLRVGSDATDYYEQTFTTNYFGNAFIDGWNQLGGVWSGFTTTGSPDVTAINYIDVIFTYDGTTQTQVRINQFYCRLGTIFNIGYYSKYLFRDTAGNFKEETDSENDYINLDTDGRNLFLYAAAIEAVQQQQGLSGMFFDDPSFNAKYNDALAEYQAKYKSEITKPRQFYYQQPTQGYRRFFGRGFWR
jgi:hypothetical protein